MSIFAHAFAIAASKPKTKCANCRHHEAIIADLHVRVEDLRQPPSPNAQPLRPPEIVARHSLLPKGHHGSATDPAEEIVEKRGKQGIKDIKEEGQAS